MFRVDFRIQKSNQKASDQQRVQSGIQFINKYGLRASLPKDLQGRIVIKVSKAKTDELVTACKEQAAIFH